MGYAYCRILILRLASRLTCVAHVSHAIANNVPPMQFSLCIWGQAHVWTWGARVVCRLSVYALLYLNEPTQGHSWRMSGDSTCVALFLAPA